jgi:hypothetical protein
MMVQKGIQVFYLKSRQMCLEVEKWRSGNPRAEIDVLVSTEVA